MIDLVYAKSNPKQTIKEHTEALINNLCILQKAYGKEIENLLPDEYRNLLWEIMEIVIKYHDLGKVNSLFQNKIRERLKLPLLKPHSDQEIPHNFLSPAFFTEDGLKKYDKDTIKVIVQSIVFHHEKGEFSHFKDIEKEIERDLEGRKNLVRDIVEIPETLWMGYERYYTIRITPKEEKIYPFYLIVKGLLHRIDHSASAFVDVEIKDDRLGNKVLTYLNLKGGLRPIQEYTKQNLDKNLIMIASTGIGKTESGLLWAGGDKTFFTLPLRVSVNAIYDRINKKIGYESTGLLHSSSLDHLDYEGYETSYEIYKNSRQLSYQLNVSTIDQLFNFPFRYGGYEKILSTLLYSKVIIDEIQSYEPKIAAVVLKGLEEVYKWGGKFLIMTATFPQFYLDILKEWNINFEFQEFLTDKKRHKIRVLKNEILEGIGEIEKLSSKQKVLVIVNTVKQAKEIYKKLNNAKMLHSMFIGEDRKRLESEIDEFSKDDKNSGIWITTQIAEASLDIDFDLLFTELSSLDSLCQRMGRCYRQRCYEANEPNVYIFTKECSGIGSIYDKEIFEFSEQEITAFDGMLLKEKDKVEMVKRIYSKDRIINTRYYVEFRKALQIIENIFDYELSKKEACEILRDIYSIKVIPLEIFEKYEDEIIEMSKVVLACKGKERIMAERVINDKTLDIPYFRTKKAGISLTPIPYLKGINIINCKYTPEEGLILNELVDNFVG